MVDERLKDDGCRGGRALSTRRMAEMDGDATTTWRSPVLPDPVTVTIQSQWPRDTNNSFSARSPRSRFDVHAAPSIPVQRMLAFAL